MSYHDAEEELDEFAFDDFEMADMDDDLFFRARVLGASDSDDDDDDDDDGYNRFDKKITDTSAAEARKGKDIQGIPWDILSISRDKYRQTRLEQYKNYENVPQSGEASKKSRNASQQGKEAITMSFGRIRDL